MSSPLTSQSLAITIHLLRDVNIHLCFFCFHRVIYILFCHILHWCFLKKTAAWWSGAFLCRFFLHQCSRRLRPWLFLLLCCFVPHWGPFLLAWQDLLFFLVLSLLSLLAVTSCPSVLSAASSFSFSFALCFHIQQVLIGQLSCLCDWSNCSMSSSTFARLRSLAQMTVALLALDMTSSTVKLLKEFTNCGQFLPHTVQTFCWLALRTAGCKLWHP